MTTEIKNKIQEFKSLRDKAASGVWSADDCGYSSLSGPMANVEPVCIYDSHEILKPDAQFIAESANRWNDLLKCLEVAVDRLQATAEEMSKDDTYIITKKRNISAISEIKNILEK